MHSSVCTATNLMRRIQAYAADCYAAIACHYAAALLLSIEYSLALGGHGLLRGVLVGLLDRHRSGVCC